MTKPFDLTGKSILIVDDEPHLRNAIAFDFKRKGCVTYEVGDGNEAFRLIEKFPIDAVISDIRMPECSGVKLLEMIRKRQPDNPVVILITGYTDIDKEEILDKEQLLPSWKSLLIG